MQCPSRTNYKSECFPEKLYKLKKGKKKRKGTCIILVARTENSYSCVQQKGPNFLFQRAIKLDIYTKQVFDDIKKDRRGDREIGIGTNRESRSSLLKKME